MHKFKRATCKILTDAEIYDMLLRTRSVESVLKSMEQKERRLKVLSTYLPNQVDMDIKHDKELLKKVRW